MFGLPISDPVGGARQLRVRLSRSWSRTFGSGFHSRCSSGVVTRFSGWPPWPPSSPRVAMPSQRSPAWNDQCGVQRPFVLRVRRQPQRRGLELVADRGQRRVGDAGDQRAAGVVALRAFGLGAEHQAVLAVVAAEQAAALGVELQAAFARLVAVFLRTQRVAVGAALVAQVGAARSRRAQRAAALRAATARPAAGTAAARAGRRSRYSLALLP